MRKIYFVQSFHVNWLIDKPDWKKKREVLYMGWPILIEAIRNGISKAKNEIMRYSYANNFMHEELKSNVFWQPKILSWIILAWFREKISIFHAYSTDRLGAWLLEAAERLLVLHYWWRCEQYSFTALFIDVCKTKVSRMANENKWMCVYKCSQWELEALKRSKLSNAEETGEACLVIVPYLSLPFSSPGNQ